MYLIYNIHIFFYFFFSDKVNRPGWLESNKIPYMIIHTLRKECPVFEDKQELTKHIENVCPYWKVNCFSYWKVNHLSSPETIIRNSHKEEKCPELSRQEFLSHSTETVICIFFIKTRK